jgi:hypothetical protein
MKNKVSKTDWFEKSIVSKRNLSDRLINGIEIADDPANQEIISDEDWRAEMELEAAAEVEYNESESDDGNESHPSNQIVPVERH